MEKLMSIGFAHLALRWSHEKIAHPRPALLPSPHLLRRIFWILSDDNLSLWIKVHLSPYTSYYLLLYIILIYNVTLNLVFFFSLPTHLCAQRNPQSFKPEVYSVVMSKFTPGGCMHVCVCMILCLLYKKDRNTTRKFRFSAIISELCLNEKNKNWPKMVKPPRIWVSRGLI